MTRIHPKLQPLAADRNLDLEDIESAVALVESGQLSKAELRELFEAEQDTLEPNAYARARGFLDGRRPGGLRNRTVTFTDAEAPRVAAALERLLGAGAPGADVTERLRGFQRGNDMHPSGVLDTQTVAAMNAALSRAGEPMLDVTPRLGVSTDAVLLSPSDGADAKPQIRKLQSALVMLSRVMDKPEYDLLRFHIDGDYGGETQGALKAFQADHNLSPSGIVDMKTMEALNQELRAHRCPTVNILPEAQRGADAERNLRPLEMHFVPEEDKLYICRKADDGNLEVVGEHPLRGGPREITRDVREDVVHGSGPTHPGTYKIGLLSRHQSGPRGWTNSLFKWGTKFRLKNGEVQFQDPRWRDSEGHWDWATGPDSYFKRNGYPPSLQPEKHDLLDSAGQPPDFWKKNDFGHMRGTLVDVISGRMRPEMLHPTPGLERNYGDDFSPEELGYSHGCMHVDPKLMDHLIGQGQLKKGTLFIVHPYGERFEAVEGAPGET